MTTRASKKQPDARYDVKFFIGPCSQKEAERMVDAILDLPEFRAVGGGGIGMGKILCACGTPTIVCDCGDDRCPKCDPDGCPAA